MVTVSNTIELEEYGLDNIKDNEKVRILGGLEGKAKYSKNEKYTIRTTYTGKHIKLIIKQMHTIENAIPKEWNKWQRAKFIYEILGRNIIYSPEEVTNYLQMYSNLSILLSRKATCAGYSLLYKEMMDRQGIECDYIRGQNHAWNVLTIDGVTFPVDLTMDASNMEKRKNRIDAFWLWWYFFIFS